jgi:WD40 repeat protein
MHSAIPRLALIRTVAAKSLLAPSSSISSSTSVPLSLDLSKNKTSTTDPTTSHSSIPTVTSKLSTHPFDSLPPPEQPDHESNEVTVILPEERPYANEKQNKESETNGMITETSKSSSGPQGASEGSTSTTTGMDREKSPPQRTLGDDEVVVVNKHNRPLPQHQRQQELQQEQQQQQQQQNYQSGNDNAKRRKIEVEQKRKEESKQIEKELLKNLEDAENAVAAAVDEEARLVAQKRVFEIQLRIQRKLFEQEMNATKAKFAEKVKREKLKLAMEKRQLEMEKRKWEMLEKEREKEKEKEKRKEKGKEKDNGDKMEQVEVGTKRKRGGQEGGTENRISQIVEPTKEVEVPESGVVRLNVGGRKFMTTISTLRKEKDSMLDSMFSGRFPVTVDSENAFFIDREGKYFGTILNYLRDPYVELPEKPEQLRAILREAEFFQVRGLIDILHRALGQQKDSRLGRVHAKYSAFRVLATLRFAEDVRVTLGGADVASSVGGGVGVGVSSTGATTAPAPYPPPPVLVPPVAPKGLQIISSIDFDADSEYFAASGIMKAIKIFRFSDTTDAYTEHKPVRILPCYAKLSCLSWSRGIKTQLLSSDYEGQVCLWDASAGSLIHSFDQHEKRVWSVAFANTTPDRFVSASDDKTVRIWRTSARKSELVINAAANVCCARFSPDDTVVAFGSSDHDVYGYDLRAPTKPLFILQEHRKAVSYVLFLNSKEAISASVDNTLKRWNLTTGHSMLTYTGHINTKNFTGLAVDGEGEHIVCGSEDNKVYLWHIDHPTHIASFSFSPYTSAPNEANFVSTVCWKPRSNIILAGNSEGLLQVLSLS